MPHESNQAVALARYLLNRDDVSICPPWPPDAFAVAGTILRQTGAYTSASPIYALLNEIDWKEKWQAAAQAGKTWRKRITNAAVDQNAQLDSAVVPAIIQEWWKDISSLSYESLRASTGGRISKGAETLISICIAADEASYGIGILTHDTERDTFLTLAGVYLSAHKLRSFCSAVPVDRAAVLGKQHTPQRGLTLRSLTHNLALYPSSEIVARWIGPVHTRESSPEIINILLLPWPTEVLAGDFALLDQRNAHDAGMPEKATVFAYSPKQGMSIEELTRRVRSAFKEAKKYATDIHAVVLPELSLSIEQYEAIEDIVVGNQSLLIAGVHVAGARERQGRSKSTKEKTPGNYSIVQAFGFTRYAGDDALRPDETHLEWLRVVQSKHHRWCMDRNQILQYKLGGKLPSSRDCWEAIDLTGRQANFLALGKWMTWSVIICEDLARQEPLSEVVRAVGPNMVIALLMDGPQLKSRWPARYASVLAEDPGCSVLTLTSLGMVKRSHPIESDQAGSQSVALWRDTIFGDRELSLRGKQDAGVLSLVCKTREEFTADGRSDKRQAYFPVYSGWHPFETDDTGPTDGESQVRLDPRAKRYRFTTEIDHGFPVLIAMMRLKNSSLARRSGATWLRGTLRRMKEQLNPDDEDDLAMAEAIIKGNEPGRLAGPAARQRYKLLRTLAGIKNQARKSGAKSARRKE